MSHIDLTLPSTVPEIAYYNDRPGELNPFAIYLLVDLPDQEIRSVTEVCNSHCTSYDYVKLAPQAKFIGASLRDVYESHLRLARGGGWDPHWFLAVNETDWKTKGILAVQLSAEEGETDKFSIKPEHSGLVLVNLQIGNEDWEEVKESEENSEPPPGANPPTVEELIGRDYGKQANA